MNKPARYFNGRAPVLLGKRALARSYGYPNFAAYSDAMAALLNAKKEQQVNG